MIKYDRKYGFVVGKRVYGIFHKYNGILFDIKGDADCHVYIYTPFVSLMIVPMEEDKND